MTMVSQLLTPKTAGFRGIAKADELGSSWRPLKPPAKKLNGDDWNCNGDLVSSIFNIDDDRKPFLVDLLSARSLGNHTA